MDNKSLVFIKRGSCNGSSYRVGLDDVAKSIVEETAAKVKWRNSEVASEMIKFAYKYLEIQEFQEDVEVNK